nr:unnamed protein product [Spirometra erinaceieuropaei]
MNDAVRALERGAVAADVGPSRLRLPLCTAEAYEDFVRRLTTEVELAGKAVCVYLFNCGWWNGCKEKRSFLACPSFSITNDAIGQNSRFSNRNKEVLRLTAINWFHGGRSERRRNIHTVRHFPLNYCPNVFSFKESPPMTSHVHNLPLRNTRTANNQ